MARPKKASKKASTTLDAYFSKPSAITKKPVPAKKSVKNKPVVPTEIIVIESDEEEHEVQVVLSRASSSKRKIAELSSDVEVLDSSLPKHHISCHSFSFGEPTLLLSSSICGPQAGPSSETRRMAAVGESPSFGLPLSLLDKAPPVHELDVPVEGDDWSMGDEVEHTAAPEDDGEVEMMEDDIYAPLEEVCQKDPPDKSITDHALSLINGDAFSVLMTSKKQNEVWKEVSVMEDRGFQGKGKGKGGRRKAPFYKVLQGMPIAVDAFKYGAIPGVIAYFLTHAHSDHYTNLSSSWAHGPIYCSEGTANLIIHMLKVDKKWVHPLPMDVATVIPNTNGVQVTLIEANHCPGSSLFFYEGRQTVNAGDSTFKSPFVGNPRIFRYLHCGDFRASPQHVLHPSVKGKRIDHVYLDTTYLDPKYTFPPQPLVISACAELAKRIVTGTVNKGNNTKMTHWLKCGPSGGNVNQNPGRILMVVGTYSIGKERIVKAIAHALETKVYCDSRKAAILRCQCDPDLHALLTSQPLEAQVHVVPLSVITSDGLKLYVERFKGHFDKAVGFRPTGWTYTQPSGTGQSPTVTAIIDRLRSTSFSHNDMTPARNSTTALQLYMVPYSEHSSFSELTCFALSFRWGKMIATVNVGSENSRGKMAKWVQKWEAERQKKETDYVVDYRHAEYW